MACHAALSAAFAQTHYKEQEWGWRGAHEDGLPGRALGRVRAHPLVRLGPILAARRRDAASDGGPQAAQARAPPLYRPVVHLVDQLRVHL